MADSDIGGLAGAAFIQNLPVNVSFNETTGFITNATYQYGEYENVPLYHTIESELPIIADNGSWTKNLGLELRKICVNRFKIPSFQGFHCLFVAVVGEVLVVFQEFLEHFFCSFSVKYVMDGIEEVFVFFLDMPGKVQSAFLALQGYRRAIQRCRRHSWSSNFQGSSRFSVPWHAPK